MPQNKSFVDKLIAEPIGEGVTFVTEMADNLGIEVPPENGNFNLNVFAVECVAFGVGGAWMALKLMSPVHWISSLKK